MAWYEFLVFLLGASVGSFLNVVLYRLGSGMTVVGGRSMCMSCKKNLAYYELIPVLSYFWLGGKCSRCGDEISWQYPVVEALSGLAFLGSFWMFGGFTMEALVSALLLVGLLGLSVYDLRHKIVPDEFVLVLLVLGLVNVLLMHGDWLDVFVNAVVPAGIFAVIWLVSRGRLIGLGDVKLMFVLGMFANFTYLILAFWIGALYALGYAIVQLVRGGDMGGYMKAEIPFVPFMVLGFVLVYVFNVDILKIVASVF